MSMLMANFCKFCKLYTTTNEECLKSTLEKREVDSKLDRQQFGSHIKESPEKDPSPVPKPSPRIIRLIRKHSQIKVIPGVLYWQQPESSKRLCLSQLPLWLWGYSYHCGADNNQKLKVTEPHSIKEWKGVQSKGCFFLQDDDETISHQ